MATVRTQSLLIIRQAEMIVLRSPAQMIVDCYRFGFYDKEVDVDDNKQ
ncbi:hypothetical protein [Paenibacillus thalictri]|nr:hypothetical protein [Paenibacillus thalictri]